MDQAPPSVTNGVTPYLSVRGASGAADFYKKAFGAQELFRMPADDGKRLMHCHLRINNADVMLADEFPEHSEAMTGIPSGGTPYGVTLHLAVDNADKWYERAVTAGAKVRMPIADQFWGDRYGIVTDPWGHAWSIASPLMK